MGFGGTDNTNNRQININSQNLNILSSQDTNNTKSNTKHKNKRVVSSFSSITFVSLLMYPQNHIVQGHTHIFLNQIFYPIFFHSKYDLIQASRLDALHKRTFLLLASYGLCNISPLCKE
jgi:hypothetical protein